MQDVRLRVGRLPGFGQDRDDVALLIHVDESVVDGAPDQSGRGVVDEGRIDGLVVGAVGDDQHTAGLDIRGGGRRLRLRGNGGRARRWLRGGGRGRRRLRGGGRC